MSADKVSILQTLLARVQERAKAPRGAPVQAARVAEISRVIEVPRVAEAARVIEVPRVVETAPEAPPVVEAIAPDPSPIVSAVQVIAQAADVLVPETPPALATLNENDLISESLGIEEEDDEAPPSAPRLREALTDGTEQAASEEVEHLQEADIEQKTPPPESGRQEVAAATSPASLEEDDDDSMEMDMSDLSDDAVAPLAAMSDAEAVAPSGDAGAAEPPLDLVADSGVNVPAPELLRADSHPTTSSSPPPPDDLVPESGVLAVPEGLARSAVSRSNDLSWPPAPRSGPPADIATPPASLVTAISSDALEPSTPSPAEPPLVALDGAIATPLPPAPESPFEPPPLIEALDPVVSPPEVIAAPDAAPLEVLAPPEVVAAPAEVIAISEEVLSPPEPIAALSPAEPPFVEPIAPPLELPAPPALAPSVRLMVEPLVALSSPDVPAVPAPPVEVWASTYASEPLRGQVAIFVGQSANFAPHSFGELLAKTLQLGQETS